eukprot:jgi/Tetstr1/447285/TSEL_034722.t1
MTTLREVIATHTPSVGRPTPPPTTGRAGDSSERARARELECDRDFDLKADRDFDLKPDWDLEWDLESGREFDFDWESDCDRDCDWAWDCWRAATTIAEWCGALDRANSVALARFRDDWRVPIPEDLYDMPLLYFHRTWEILEGEHKVHAVKNRRTELLLSLSVHHRMHNLLK